MQVSGVMNCKPGKDDYTKRMAYRHIFLLSWMGNLFEMVVVELLSEAADSRGLPHNWQFGSRKRWAALDTMAIMVDRAHAAWTTGHMIGVLLMGIWVAFPSVAKGKLVNGMKVTLIDGQVTQ
jgi:hypothetical protein